MIVQNCERTLAIALESLSNVYDELIIVDGGSNDSTGDIALSYGAKLISSPWTGNYSQQRNVYLKQVKTDWVFVLDSDEFIDMRVLKFLNLLRSSSHHTWETDNFSIMRKWISPFSKNHYIVSYPHFPDWRSRLFQYNENIFYEGQIHESIINFAHNQNLLLDENTLINPNALNSDHLEKPLNELASIYHLDLFINSKAQRRAKVRKYSQLDPKDGARHYYLPNEKELQLIAWDGKEITPSVQVLLNNLSNSSEGNTEALVTVNNAQTPSTMNSAPVSELPIHFFTIVLNGQPFIRYHIEVFSKLPFSWHWHIIEGVADLRNDTQWSLKSGGRIIDDMHKNGLSNDGTTEYIDEIKQQYPQNITVYRKSDGSFWHGKREMVNEPLYEITEECLLWQVDVDELWTVAQICVARQMFIDHPEKTAAFYWCLYFVGQNIIVSNRYCYSQNPKQEWLRTWRYKSGAVWVAHEPPRLEEPFLYRLNPQESAICIEWREVSSVNPFTHQQTENLGLVFQHFAYVTENQLRFKEKYYGYKDAVSQWEALQKNTNFPAYLREYFPWVTDETQVDLASLLGIVPIAQKNPENDDWHFLEVTEIKKTSLTILVDGVFFQMYKTGIARVWKSLLEEWSNNGFAKHVIVLNRNGTAPKIPGIAYLDIPLHDYNNITADQEMLQQICNREGADLFISSYYTTPISTPSVLMIHDMIPEIFDWNLEHPMWQEKHHAIHQASAYIAVSENTAKDLVKFFPHISWSSITIAHNGVNHHIFSAAPQEIINHFRIKYGIDQPYFLLVGAPDGYKNSILFFRAFAQLASHHGFDIVITSNSGSPLSPELRTYTSGTTVHALQLSDEELAMAYSGAVALVYPSKYEGFGMPIVEAMACGCPVITCPNASIPEVGGDAVVYVNDEDVNALVNALCDVQKPSFRKSLTSSGLSQAEKFSWTKMAQTVSDVLVNTMSLALNLTEIK